MNNGNKTRPMAGMTMRAAACGVFFAIAVSASLVTAGVHLGDGGNQMTSILMIAAMTGMLLVGLFSAWNAGRASALTSDRRDSGVPDSGRDQGRPEEPVAA